MTDTIAVGLTSNLVMVIVVIVVTQSVSPFAKKLLWTAVAVLSFNVALAMLTVSPMLVTLQKMGVGAFAGAVFGIAIAAVIVVAKWFYRKIQASRNE